MSSITFVGGISIAWHGMRPPNYEKVFDALYKDIFVLDRDLKKQVNRLCFHVVLLDRYRNGRSVFVWSEGDGHYHCEYQHKTEWVTSND